MNLSSAHFELILYTAKPNFQFSDFELILYTAPQSRFGRDVFWRISLPLSTLLRNLKAWTRACLYTAFRKNDDPAYLLPERKKSRHVRLYARMKTAVLLDDLHLSDGNVNHEVFGFSLRRCRAGGLSFHACLPCMMALQFVKQSFRSPMIASIKHSREHSFGGKTRQDCVTTSADTELE